MHDTNTAHTRERTFRPGIGTRMGNVLTILGYYFGIHEISSATEWGVLPLPWPPGQDSVTSVILDARHKESAPS